MSEFLSVTGVLEVIDTQIEYKSGFKHVQNKDYRLRTKIIGYDIDTEFIKLAPDGVLTVKRTYAWDGPSGPVRDTSWTMLPSLPHDALYQLFREELIPVLWREYADKIYRELLIISAKNHKWRKRFFPFYRWRAQVQYDGLRLLGGPAADPSHKKEIHTAS